jgi:tRNA A37 threonylcarbamoyladenosine biosynthesis protein TsaE
MRYPTWNEFLGKNPKDPEGAFEALCRLLFKSKYGIRGSLPYFYNHPGIETSPVFIGEEVIGFQSKFFSGETINDSQAEEITKSIQVAHKHNASLTKIILYTNSVFAFPAPDSTIIRKQAKVEQAALDINVQLEWMFGNNILDAVAQNPLAYSIFFDLYSNLSHISESVNRHNSINFDNIGSCFQYQGQEIRIDRTVELGKLKELLAQGKSVLVYGESGSGKSGIIKDLWQAYKENEETIFFYTQGRQYGARSINDLFSFDEEYTFVGFRDFFDSYATKVLVIDSAERVLEQENKTVFQLVLDALREKGWQFIFTCKSNAYNEFRSLLRDIRIVADEMEVNVISEERLHDLSQQYAIQLPESSKLIRQLQIPFYLARYCEIGGYDITTPEVFREKVWAQKVRGTVKGGNQQKREDCLIDIVKEQQATNTYYVNPTSIDHDIAYELIAEDILIHVIHKGYAVKHDIYVDWALDYVIDYDFRMGGQYKSVLSLAPQSISYANSFSRWFDGIIDSDDVRTHSIIEAFNNGEVHKKWEHIILSCIGKSEHLVDAFFNNYSELLKERDYALFDRFVDVLSVSCQRVKHYYEYGGKRFPFYVPVGKGWDNAVLFVFNNKRDYYWGHLGVVLNLLKGYSRMDETASARVEAAKLSLYIFELMAEVRLKKETIWADSITQWAQLVCEYAYSIRKELRGVFHQVIDNNWVNHRDPYAELIAYILKDSNNLSKSKLYLSCLDEVIDLMDLFWKEQEMEKGDGPVGYHRSFDNDYCFGLNDYFTGHLTYFPSSPFQTPIGFLFEAERLLDSEGTRVLDFLIRFVDKCVFTYEKRSDYEKPERIALHFSDGSSHDVILSSSLWNLYRGTSNITMPHLIESIHMALEKHLLYLTDERNNPDWKHVNLLLWRILNTSHSASLFSIVASLAIAHTEEFYDIFLFVCQDIRFLRVDLQRYSMEINADLRKITFHRHELWWKERDQSNRLPHRQEHLETVLLKCQYAYDNSRGEESEQRLKAAYAVVDNLKEQVAKLGALDSTYGFIYSRVNYRAYDKHEVTLKDGGRAIELIPKLTPEQKAISREAMDRASRMGAMGVRVWADRLFKGEIDSIKGSPYVSDPSKALPVLRAIEEESNKGIPTVMLPGDEYVPYFASAVLLMYHQESLTDEEKKECWERVKSALTSHTSMVSNTLSEFNICMAAIPCMMKMYPNKVKDFSPVISCLIQDRSRYINERICDMMSKVIVDGNLWEKYPSVLYGVLENLSEGIPDKKWESMDTELADTVLCLLTHIPIDVLRPIGRICIEKLSTKWRIKLEYELIDEKESLADNISRYILFSPTEEAKLLVAPFVHMLELDSSGEPLVTHLLINNVQYGKYASFWAVWEELYKTITTSASYYYQNEVLNEYLLNPFFLRHDSDNWFLLEEKDLDFFKRVVKDIGGHPVVMYALSHVFATIGKEFSEDAIRLFSLAISSHNPQLLDSKNSVVFYMDIIVKRVLTEKSDVIQKDIQFKNELLTVLMYLRSYGSKIANDIINTL